MFYGVLDNKTLGGAGFASQRTSTKDETWDLHSYDGVELELDGSHSDSKEYTFILKDILLGPNAENGREQATISWEADFSVSQDELRSQSVSTFFAWDAFKPTYRGKKQARKHGPDLRNIKRFSIMMRRCASLSEVSTAPKANKQQLLWLAGRRIPLDHPINSGEEGLIREHLGLRHCRFEAICR